MTAPRLRIGVATAALRGLADALEEVAIPESRVATRREVESIVAEAIAVTRLLRGAPRACATCGNPIVRKRYDDGHLESPADYARRQYCDRTCKGVAIRTIKTDAARACKVCRAPIERHPGEPWSKYQRRSTCGGDSCIRAARAMWTGPRKSPNRKPRDHAKPAPSAPPPQASPARARPAALPDPRPATHASATRIRTLGEPCPKHPTNTVGHYGCPACNASRNWRRGERRITARPSPEGGR